VISAGSPCETLGAQIPALSADYFSFSSSWFFLFLSRSHLPKPGGRGGGWHSYMTDKVGDACRLGYKSRILVSLRVLMMKQHHF